MHTNHFKCFYLGLLLACLCGLARVSSADVVYIDPTNNCASQTAIGRATFCCDGACYDGTQLNIFSGFPKDGLCGTFDTFCDDPPVIPNCNDNQVLLIGGQVDQDAGLGSCYLPHLTNCQWQNTAYTYSCCSCPSGYVPSAQDCSSSLNSAHGSTCVGCSDPNESPQFDDGSQSWACQPAFNIQHLCDVADTTNTGLSVASLAVTALGGICPANDFFSITTTLLQDAVSALTAYGNPSPGLTGNKAALVVAAVSTITAFTIGAAVVASGVGAAVAGLEIATVAESLTITYGEACSFDAGLGIGLTLEANALDQFVKNACPAPSSKTKRSRSTLPMARYKRDSMYNPCAEFLSYFPSNYEAFTDADTACNETQLIDAGSLANQTVANAVTTLQQFCTAYQSFGKSALFIDFGNMVNALQAVVPYCDIMNMGSAVGSSSSYLATYLSSSSVISSISNSPVTSVSTPSLSLSMTVPTPPLSLSMTALSTQTGLTPAPSKSRSLGGSDGFDGSGGSDGSGESGGSGASSGSSAKSGGKAAGSGAGGGQPWQVESSGSLLGATGSRGSGGFPEPAGSGNAVRTGGVGITATYTGPKSSTALRFKVNTKMMATIFTFILGSTFV